MKGIGIIPGYRPALIDHLIPLCALMEAPVLVTHPFMKCLIELYYPAIEVVLAEPEDGLLDEALKDYDLLLYVHYSRQVNDLFVFDEYVARKRARSIMCLHGNPDKFQEIYWLENLADEDIVLAYGPQLVKLIEQKRIPKTPLVCGNYRLEYYHAHEAFFDAKLPFKKEKPLILYAPTWAANNRKIELRKYYTSFLQVYQELFETLPDDFQLVVKLHPLHASIMYEEIQQIKAAYPQIYFLDDYPLVYPLLKHVDYFIGDYSSIGYDFLYFDRPLFFLGSLKKTPLQDCGLTIHNAPIYETIKNYSDAPYSQKRQTLYRHVFGQRKSLNELKEELVHAY